MDSLKTFKDLEFKKHKSFKDSVHAVMEFNNGTFISVVGGASGLYGDGKVSFEIMSTVTQRKSYGVEGWLSKRQVTNRMRYLQKIKRK